MLPDPGDAGAVLTDVFGSVVVPLATDFETGVEAPANFVFLFLVLDGLWTVVTGFLPVTGVGLTDGFLAKVFGFAFAGGATTGAGAGAVVAAKDSEFAAQNKIAHKLIINFFKSVLQILTTGNYIEFGSICKRWICFN